MHEQPKLMGLILKIAMPNGPTYFPFKTLEICTILNGTQPNAQTVPMNHKPYGRP
jgi:hypothetical protein